MKLTNREARGSPKPSEKGEAPVIGPTEASMKTHPQQMSKDFTP